MVSNHWILFRSSAVDEKAPMQSGIAMHPRTIATLEDLDRASWFAMIGVKDTDGAMVLSSWPEAIGSCAAREWDNLCLEAANQYRERLVERNIERFRKWNEIALEIKPVVGPFVHGKVESVVRANKLPKVFEDCVRWDILHLCMECEYADVYPPGFFASQAYWYVHGHFPCGWEGSFPEGKLIIY